MLAKMLLVVAALRVATLRVSSMRLDINSAKTLVDGESMNRMNPATRSALLAMYSMENCQDERDPRCKHYKQFLFTKARPECTLPTRESFYMVSDGICDNCWPWASTRVFAERMCSQTNGASFMRPSAFQLDDCHKHEQGEAPFKVCHRGNGYVAHDYLTTKGTVSETIYGNTTWHKHELGYGVDEGELASCRISKNVDPHYGYQVGDPRLQILQEGPCKEVDGDPCKIGNPEYHNYIVEEATVIVPPFLFTGTNPIQLARPWLRRLTDEWDSYQRRPDVSAARGTFAEESPEETAGFIKGIQELVLREGPVVAGFYTVKEKVAGWSGHDMALHGWERREDGRFIWILHNSQGHRSESNKGELTSFKPDNEGHTYIQEPSTMECRGCEHLVLGDVIGLTPELPGATSIVWKMSGGKKVPGGKKFIMPDHRVDATLLPSGDVSITAQLGDHDDQHGGSGKGVNLSHSPAGVWASTMKFMVIGEFLSFTSGKIERVRQWTKYPQRKGKDDVLNQVLNADTFSGRGLLTLKMFLSAKSDVSADGELYTSKDLLIPGSGPTTGRALSELYQMGSSISVEAASALRRWISSYADGSHLGSEDARLWGAYSWSRTSLKIWLPTDVSTAGLSVTGQGTFSLANIRLVKPVNRKAWGMFTYDCNGFELELKTGEKPFIACATRKRGQQRLDDFVEKLKLAITVAKTFSDLSDDYFPLYLG